MSYNPRVFREYDIRGVAERHLDDELAAALGRALHALWSEAGIDGPAVVGRDCRLSSPRLHAALRGALLASGRSVIDVGLCPTPLVYFSLFEVPVSAAVMITGSHNPGDENGFKIALGKTTIHGEVIGELRRRVEEEMARPAPPAAQPGALEVRDLGPAYLAALTSRLQLGARRFRLVVDGGNGMGGFLAVPLFRQLGFEVVELFCEPDGRFPNHHPDPTQPENLAALIASVREHGAELGVAYDGDADRLGAVTPSGRIVWGDELLVLFARAILAEVPGATFVSEVKCSKVTYDEITRLGGRPIMGRVGHSPIKAKLAEVGALLAGEMSGHFFFAHRYHGYDDAIYASARLVELCTRTGATLDEQLATLPRMFSTPELRADCADEVKFQLVERVRAHFQAELAGSQRPDLVDLIDIDGVRLNYTDGWALVRASNTQAALVLRFEAGTPERLNVIRAEMETLVSRLEQESQGGGEKGR